MGFRRTTTLGLAAVLGACTSSPPAQVIRAKPERPSLSIESTSGEGQATILLLAPHNKEEARVDRRTFSPARPLALRWTDLTPGPKHLALCVRPHPPRFYRVDGPRTRLRVQPPTGGALRITGHLLDAAGNPLAGVRASATFQTTPPPVGPIVYGSLLVGEGFRRGPDGRVDPRGRAHAHGGIAWTLHPDGRFEISQTSDDHGCFELELPRALWKPGTKVHFTHGGKTFDRTVDPATADNVIRLPVGPPAPPDSRPYEQAVERLRALMQGIDQPWVAQATSDWLRSLAARAGSADRARIFLALRSRALDFLDRRHKLPPDALVERERLRGRLAAVLSRAAVMLDPRFASED